MEKWLVDRVEDQLVLLEQRPGCCKPKSRLV
jgi:hypothetical protein